MGTIQVILRTTCRGRERRSGGEEEDEEEEERRRRKRMRRRRKTVKVLSGQRRLTEATELKRLD